MHEYLCWQLNRNIFIFCSVYVWQQQQLCKKGTEKTTQNQNWNYVHKDKHENNVKEKVVKIKIIKWT